MVKVEFIDEVGVAKEFHPVPAKRLIPEWYRKMPTFRVRDENGEPQNAPKEASLADITPTMKKCIPVWDSISAGYLILLPTDVVVQDTEDGAVKFLWPDWEIIVTHNPLQTIGYPGEKHGGNGQPKFHNPWRVKTPPGYSCLFTAPMHRENIIEIFDGIVDTDTYKASVEFPFAFNDLGFRGIIPAGTPVAQVIPFRRENYEMEVVEENPEARLDWQTTSTFLRSFFKNSYRNQIWNKKSYN